MPPRLHVVISGILAGGTLGFRSVFLLLPHLRMAILVVLLVFVFQMACAVNSTKLLSNSLRAPHCPIELFFGCVFCLGFVWFVFLVCFCGLCFLFGLFCFLSLCFPAAIGQLNGLRKGPHLLSFVAFSSDGFACFSQLIFGKYKLVERPGESHEGVGRKKRVPMSLALSLCQYMLRPKRGLAQASPGLAWLRPGLAEPRSASIAGLHQHSRKGKIVMIKTRRYKRLVVGFVLHLKLI